MNIILKREQNLENVNIFLKITTFFQKRKHLLCFSTFEKMKMKIPRKGEEKKGK